VEQDGDPAASVPLYERVVKILEGAYGGEHPLLSVPLYRLGRVQLKRGRAAVAEPLLRRALAVGRREEPFYRQEVVWPRLALARCLTGLERFADAQALLVEAVADGAATDSDRRAARRGLAELYEAWGEREKAAEQRRLLEAEG
jgi:tetratricopeptide (TPR) repeat protein